MLSKLSIEKSDNKIPKASIEIVKIWSDNVNFFMEIRFLQK